MKIQKTILLFTLSLLISNHGWATETKGVVVTIKPLHSMVSGVIGNTGKAKLLLTANTSPHDFQLKPSQVKAMQDANVVFYIHNSFETFLRGALESLPNHIRKAPVVKKAGLIVLTHRKGGAWDAHKHDAHEHEAEGHHDDHKGHDHEDDHHDDHKGHDHEDDHHDDHKGHDHEDDHHDEHGHHDAHDDMHVWLDPENARRVVTYIAKELSVIYPENSNVYKANARAYIKKIDALDAELKTSLKGVQDKPFIVFHDAYQYFERTYGLSAVGSITFEPDESPSPNRIKEVRKKLQQTGAGCVFSEPQFSDRLVKTVTEKTDAQSGTLDPLGANLKDGEELYFNLMRNLADSIKKCLK